MFVGKILNLLYLSIKTHLIIFGWNIVNLLLCFKTFFSQNFIFNPYLPQCFRIHQLILNMNLHHFWYSTMNFYVSFFLTEIANLLNFTLMTIFFTILFKETYKLSQLFVYLLKVFIELLFFFYLLNFWQN